MHSTGSWVEFIVWNYHSRIVWGLETSALSLLPYYPMRDELVYCDWLLFRDNRVVVPKVMRTDMLAKIHESLQGVVKSKQRARSILFWPGMNADVENVVSSCVTCQRFRKNQAPWTLDFSWHTRQVLGKIGCWLVFNQRYQLSNFGWLLFQIPWDCCVTYQCCVHLPWLMLLKHHFETGYPWRAHFW